MAKDYHIKICPQDVDSWTYCFYLYETDVITKEVTLLGEGNDLNGLIQLVPGYKINV